MSTVSRQREWQRANPEKHAAQRAAYEATVRGTLVRPATCSRCPNGSPHAHHDDYSKPLDVIWLCKECHVAHHVALRAVDPEVIARRETSKRREQAARREYLRSEARRVRCQSCGDLCGIGRRTTQVCRACRMASRRERRMRIAAMHADGATLVELAAALNSTPGSVSVEMTKMRHDGWDLPYRREGWTKRVAA